MKKITIITAIFGILIMGDAAAQQTPMYSQYMFNMMNINPAYTGSREVPNLTMNNLVQAVKATGRIGVVGVFLPEDPNGPDALGRRGSTPSAQGARGRAGRLRGRRD